MEENKAEQAQAELEELYNYIEFSKKLNVELSDSVLWQVTDAENRWIAQAMMPAIREHLEPLLNILKNSVNLAIDYRPGEPVKVQVSREGQPVKAKPSRLHRSPACESGQGHRRSISILRIWINDHDCIQEKNAVQSMIKAVNLAGPARVAALRIPTTGEYLVQKNCNKVERYAISQKELNDGWLLQTCCNSAQKKKQLERISDALGLGWRVELVEKH